MIITLPGKDRGPIIGIRHLQVFLVFLCCLISYYIRINVSVAIVTMTNNSTNPDFQTFNWNGAEQSYILSSFFWGYVITQLPGGHFAQKYGAKYVLLFAVLIPSILSLLTPICIEYGDWRAFCAIRIIQGLFQGVLFPSFQAFLSKWCPVNERNMLGAFCHSGVEVGTILAFGTTGMIACSELGWPGISYVTGSIGIIWSLVWYLIGCSQPAHSSIITVIEQKYIETSIKCNQTQEQQQSEQPVYQTPWLKICTSVPFLALLCCRIGFGWGFATLLTQIPSYLHYILNMNIQNNALYSALPYLCMLMTSYSLIFVAQLITRRQLLTLNQLRKIFNSIAFYIPGLSLLLIVFIETKPLWLTILLLTLAIGTNGAHTLGSVLNHIDLSPRHAGILMGITNTFGNITSIIAPLLVGIIVTDKTNTTQWHIILSIAAILYIFCNSIYLLFGEMVTQPWNDQPESSASKSTASTLDQNRNTAHQIKIP